MRRLWKDYSRRGMLGWCVLLCFAPLPYVDFVLSETPLLVLSLVANDERTARCSVSGIWFELSQCLGNGVIFRAMAEILIGDGFDDNIEFWKEADKC
jgi:hypothetical protein